MNLFKDSNGQVSSMRLAFLVCVGLAAFLVVYNTVTGKPVDWTVVTALLGPAMAGKAAQKLGE